MALIHLADLIISRFHVGLEIERISADHLSDRLKILGLSLDQLPRLAEMAFKPVADECGASIYTAVSKAENRTLFHLLLKDEFPRFECCSGTTLTPDFGLPTQQSDLTD